MPPTIQTRVPTEATPYDRRAKRSTRDLRGERSRIVTIRNPRTSVRGRRVQRVCDDRSSAATRSAARITRSTFWPATLREVLVRVAAVGELGEQRRVRRDVLEPVGHPVAARRSRSRRRRGRSRPGPGCGRCDRPRRRRSWAASAGSSPSRSTAARTASGSSGCSAFRRRISSHSAWFAFAPSAVRNHGHERRPYHAARTTDQLDDVVGHVARHVAERAGVRVREDHRRARDLDRLAHRVLGHVREVDEHAEPVQLADHLLAERRQPAVRAQPGPRVGPGRVVVVREGEVARRRAPPGPAARRASRRSSGRPRRRSSRRPCPAAAIRSTSSAVRASSSRSGCARRSANIASICSSVWITACVRRRGPTGRRRTRTGLARRPPPAAGDRCGGSERTRRRRAPRRPSRARLPKRPEQVVVPVDQGRRPQQLDDPVLGSIVGHRPSRDAIPESEWYAFRMSDSDCDSHTRRLSRHSSTTLVSSGRFETKADAVRTALEALIDAERRADVGPPDRRGIPARPPGGRRRRRGAPGRRPLDRRRALVT